MDVKIDYVIKSRKMTTVAEFKAGATLPEPIYVKKAYVILKDNVVLAAASLEDLGTLAGFSSGYYDKCEIDIRRYDLYSNNNERLPANNYQI